MATYGELLRDPRWQRKRLTIMERDGFACTQCGNATSELQVHHRYYAKDHAPWEYEDQSLATLCDACHEFAEGLRRDLIKAGGLLSIPQAHEAIGFMEGLVLSEGPDDQIVAFGGPWHLLGLSKAMGFDPEEVMPLFKGTMRTTSGALKAKVKLT